MVYLGKCIYVFYMYIFYENLLKLKLYELVCEVNKKHNEIENIKSVNKMKEDTYKEIISYLQSVNLSLLQVIIEGKKS